MHNVGPGQKPPERTNERQRPWKWVGDVPAAGKEMAGGEADDPHAVSLFDERRVVMPAAEHDHLPPARRQPFRQRLHEALDPTDARRVVRTDEQDPLAAAGGPGGGVTFFQKLPT